MKTLSPFLGKLCALSRDIDIAIDFHAKTSPSVASILVKEVEPLNLLFIEEPCPLAQKPGVGFDLTEQALAKYPFDGAGPMARVFHEDGSVAEW